MGISEFKAERGALAAELKLLILDVGEMGLDDDTVEVVVDKANGLLAKVDDSVSEKEMDRIRTDLGRLQIVIHQAVIRRRNALTDSASYG